MKFTHIKDNKDGSADFNVDLTEEDVRNLRWIAKTKKRRYSNKFIREAILEGITNAMKKCMADNPKWLPKGRTIQDHHGKVIIKRKKK
jgi:hypothetical protein